MSFLRFAKQLGKHDQLVQWIKPKEPPKWRTPEQWAGIPDSLLVRELRYKIKGKGQRTRVVTIATTLLDPRRYPKEEVAALYGIRWTVETHFAEFKTTLKMRKVLTRPRAQLRKALTKQAKGA